MKGLKLLLGILAIASFIAPTAAKADVDVHLDYVANSLVFATKQMLTELKEHVGTAAHVSGDAETLYDAAEHFKEEVELGPTDLDQDFATLGRIYADCRDDIANSYEIKTVKDIRAAWFDVQEGWVNLREAWADHTDH